MTRALVCWLFVALGFLLGQVLWQSFKLEPDWDKVGERVFFSAVGGLITVMAFAWWDGREEWGG